MACSITENLTRLIDCDALPSVPKGFEIRPEDQPSNAVGGLLAFDPRKVVMHVDEGQKNGSELEGPDLAKRLAHLPVLKANVLDYLLEHPHLIPEDWAWYEIEEGWYPNTVWFWGTVYHKTFLTEEEKLCLHHRGALFIRGLTRASGEWKETFLHVIDEDELSTGFEESDSAAVLST